MFDKSHNYCVILAGGKGRRLWPVSREAYPKQFVDFFGTGRTLLQQTYDRVAKLLPAENIFISTHKNYYELVKAQLPDVDDAHIMAEPIFRNTAPSVAWAAHRIGHLDQEACLMAVPSDQMVLNEDEFARSIAEAFAFVGSHEGILTMGVQPTRPEPGYGYIQKGEPQSRGIYAVQSFTEKPERDFARMFMESGEFFWNTGIFLSTTRFLKTCFKTLLPELFTDLEKLDAAYSIAHENAFVEEHFALYPNISMDYGVFEKTEEVYVMECKFGWADVGTWHSVYEMCQEHADDNVVIDSNVVFDDCKNTIVRLPKGRLAVLNGLDGYIVADSGNVLLVCKKEDSSALIRKYINEVRLNKGDAFV